MTHNDHELVSDSPAERVRWHTQRFTAKSPEEFNARRHGGPPWFSVGRNHGTWQDEKGSGIMREVRDDDEFVEVEDEHGDILGELVVGRTIVAIEREPSSGQEWSDGENSVLITLSDGARLRFVGWGYDASGVDTLYSPPKGEQGDG